MPTSTHVALNTVTLASAASAATFTSIPQGYTDLILVCNVGSQSTNAFPYLQFNGDTGTNYSFSQLYGTGSGAFNSRVANTNQLFNSDVSMKQDAVNATNIYHIMNYSNTTTFKTSLSRQNTLDAADYNGALAAVGIWRSTAAINRIDVKATRGGTAYNFIAGSTFTLYGVKSWADEATPKATGGYVYSDATYWYHAYPFSSSLTVTTGLTADILVIAGGGSGGQSGGAGGGGAGGLTYTSAAYLGPATYPITVGAGGTGNRGNGSNSQFGILTASVGGGGGGYDDGANVLDNGASGGSGGGGSIDSSGRASGTSGQGNQGGLGKRGSNNILSGGGGGGAGAAGVDAGTSIDTPGSGGDGVSTYSSWGLVTQTGENVNGTVWYAGGGAGTGWNGSMNAAGGLGGGGSSDKGVNGKVLTGGGGRGYFGNGGSGVVIVRYTKA